MAEGGIKRDGCAGRGRRVMVNDTFLGFGIEIQQLFASLNSDWPVSRDIRVEIEL
jgi:hypothetical protein